MNRLPVLFGVPFLCLAVAALFATIALDQDRKGLVESLVVGIPAIAIGLCFVLRIRWIRHVYSASIILLWVVGIASILSLTDSIEVIVSSAFLISGILVSIGLIMLLYSRAYAEDLGLLHPLHSHRPRLRTGIILIFSALCFSCIVIGYDLSTKGTNPLLVNALVIPLMLFFATTISLIRRLQLSRVLIRICTIFFFLATTTAYVLEVISSVATERQFATCAFMLIILAGLHWSFYRISYHPHLLGYPDNASSRAHPDILDSW